MLLLSLSLFRYLSLALPLQRSSSVVRCFCCYRGVCCAVAGGGIEKAAKLVKAPPLLFLRSCSSAAGYTHTHTTLDTVTVGHRVTRTRARTFVWLQPFQPFSLVIFCFCFYFYLLFAFIFNLFCFCLFAFVLLFIFFAASSSVLFLYVLKKIHAILLMLSPICCCCCCCL